MDIKTVAHEWARTEIEQIQRQRQRPTTNKRTWRIRFLSTEPEPIVSVFFMTKMQLAQAFFFVSWIFFHEQKKNVWKQCKFFYGSVKYN